MSQYPPPNGYGQYHGQLPPQQFGYELPQNYPPPSYNSSYNTGAADAASNTIHSSFNYNASRIPGLAIGGGVGVAPFNPALGSHAWIQTPGLTENTQPVPQPITTPGAGLSTGDSARTSSLSRAQRPVVQSATKPVAVAVHPALNTDVEEGELSEGQFEDLYEPRESLEPASNTQGYPKLPSAVNGSSGVVSAADTPNASFYANDEDEAGTGTNGKGDGAVSRERSGSYSPFLSPRETPNDNSLSRDAGQTTEIAQQSAAYSTDRNTDERKQVVPGLQFASKPLQNGSESSNPAQSALPPSDQPSSFRSVEEAAKEARKAVLRLWPLGVRFQQYVDEGFDEKVIRSLFKDLNLDISNTGGLAQATTKKDSQSKRQEMSKDSESGQPVQEQQAKKKEPIDPPKGPSAMSGQAKKGEERKDRIARLLAAKAAKAPAQPQAPPTQPQALKPQEKRIAPPTAPAAMSRPKAWGEKELLLQQKIAALQEAQARKATNSQSGSGSSQAVQDASSSAPTPPEHGPDVGSPSNKAGPGASQIPSDLGNSQPVSSIPGLLLPSIPTGPRNHRKRPVASDFVDVPSGPRSHKRPFGQHRKETSFVIDVSDASEDEEMDMDIESPAGDSSSILHPGTSSQRGPSIRDFPPLTDTLPPRQISSPIPSSNTPLGKPILTKKRETELDIKEKAIQEMKRKIAEAEAKAVAKQRAKLSSDGSQTPNPAELTPEFKDNEQSSSSGRSDKVSVQLLSEATSARLPKASETSHKFQKAERRGRIVSLDLPKIDETLEGKMNRLKQLREEEERLQAEIDRQLAEKKRLTEELEQLGDSSSDGHHQLNGLSSDDTTGVPTPPQGETSGIHEASSAQALDASEQNELAGDISMDEDESSLESSRAQTPLNASDYQPSTSEMVLDDRNPEASEETRDNQLAVSKHSLGEENALSGVQEASVEQSPVASVEFGLGDVVGGPSVDAVVDGETDIQVDPRADSVESGNPAPMELESSSPSPSNRATNPDIADDELQQTRQSSVALLDQISSVAQPREEVQEIEITETREVHVVSPAVSRHFPLTVSQVNVAPKQQPKSGFVPYNSPLRYFHAYRFHPSYSDTVAGGLKSLTYSNRINPQKPFCPSELLGNQCPANCEFQHFRSIGTPNDQILLELGKADEYTGEQKSRFIQGLRKLLQDIREKDRQDFDSIAREIIEYRSRFLGDKSKILPLEGVTL